MPIPNQRLYNPTPAQSAAPIYAGAQAATNQAANSAANLAAATPPKSYQFDPYQADQNAALLSRLQVLQNQKALQDRSPEAAQGQSDAIKTISGGVAGDDAFLSNAALKAGLEGGVANGTIGAGSVTSPNSRGGVTAANIFGSNLLNYRNSRAQQQLGLAQQLQPDAAVNPGDAISAMEASKQGAIQNQNNWQTYLANLRLGQAGNLQSQEQQSEAASQGALNANAQAANAGKAQMVSAGTALATAAAGAAVIL